jgi:hypothetical protein
MVEIFIISASYPVPKYSSTLEHSPVEEFKGQAKIVL